MWQQYGWSGIPRTLATEGTARGVRPQPHAHARTHTRPSLGTPPVQLASLSVSNALVCGPADIWDTAGQERFNSMHSSYYYRAHACIMVFDVTRKITYKNLDKWYDELQMHAKGVPTIVVANKIDVDYKVTSKSFNFAAKRKLPFFFVSASDGTNVVKIFNMAILAGMKWKAAPKDDFYQEVLDLLGEVSMDNRKQLEDAVRALEEQQQEADA